jgi:hypothetical protein
MTVAKVMEITARSQKSFEDAIQQGIERANSTVQNIEGAWIKEQKINMKNGRVDNYQVDMKVTFILKS